MLKVSILVFMNAILIGAQTDYAAQHGGASGLTLADGSRLPTAKTVSVTEAPCHGAVLSTTRFVACMKDIFSERIPGACNILELH